MAIIFYLNRGTGQGSSASKYQYNKCKDAIVDRYNQSMGYLKQEKYVFKQNIEILENVKLSKINKQKC